MSAQNEKGLINIEKEGTSRHSPHFWEINFSYKNLLVKTLRSMLTVEQIIKRKLLNELLRIFNRNFHIYFSNRTFVSYVVYIYLCGKQWIRYDVLCNYICMHKHTLLSLNNFNYLFWSASWRRFIMFYKHWRWNSIIRVYNRHNI